jgi:molybdate transport system ATP-binding protein
MSSPRLLLVDDNSTTGGGVGASRILPFLSRVREELGIPVMYVSHTLGDILQLTDQMVLIANGRILGVGDVHDIIANRILLATSVLQGIENVLPVTILDHDVQNGCSTAYYYGAELVLPIASHLPRNASARISVRSSSIALSKQYLGGISIQNQIKGRVCAVIRSSEHAVVQIDCGTTLLAGVSLRALRDMDLQEGDTVYCLIKAHAFSYVFENATTSLNQPVQPLGAANDEEVATTTATEAGQPAIETPFSPTKH